jgi:hypothetical protein
MSSILKVDTIQDQSGNNIINENADTITIGASGDTVNIVGTLQNNGSAVGGGTQAFDAGTAGDPSITTTGDTNTGIFFPAADTIAFTEGGTEAMRIDSSGNVGIGTSSPSANLEVRGASSNGQIYLGGSTTATYGKFYSDNDGTLIVSADAGNNAASSYFGVEVDGTERMRIDSGGGLGVGDTPFATTRLTLKAPASGNQYMVYGKNGAGTNVLIIAGDGSITNYYGSYGTISDENLKQDIVNANSQWNDIKSLEIKNYKLRSDVELNPETAPNLLGVIAQDLESSNMSGLVSVQNEVLWSENDELPEGVNVGDIKEPSHKSVKYSVLYMKAVKALQEAMERIEQLEARITTLENN